MSNFQNEVRQLLAYGLLRRFDRLEEANIGFTFRADHLYLSAFTQALEEIKNVDFSESNIELARLAQVFEEFISTPALGINRAYSALISASVYWLSGYTANALVLSRLLSSEKDNFSITGKTLLSIFERETDNFPADQDGLGEFIKEYIRTGDQSSFEKAISISRSREDECLDARLADEFVVSRLLNFVIQRLGHVSFWASIENLHSAPKDTLVNYLSTLSRLQKPIIDLWPSQRMAISKGLIDGKSSLVVSMPTSSGKTKMTELAFVNDLFTNDDRKCLYLAPFRALVSEVESNIGNVFTEMGISVASLYGGADANEIEVEISEKARLIIATPEKISAVLKLSDKKLTSYQTIVLDEGHLIDSLSRGVSYEFQLAYLRSQVSDENRVIFLSAVLPNSDEVASWLIGIPDKLAKTEWQPTTMRIGVVTWPIGSSPRLTYRVETGQPLLEDFFIPKLFEQEIWREVDPQTGGSRSYTFPRNNDNGSVAAALAFQYSKLGQVIVYAQRPDWAVSTANKMLDRLKLQKQVDAELVNETNKEELEEIAIYFERRLGPDSVLAKSIRQGFAIHHGRVPQSLRSIIEDAFRKQILRILIATNTIAQGVNFPAKTLIVHSLPRTETQVRDFWNLAGRAGRASKETLGEVVILQTGGLSNRVLRNFIEKRIENVNSKVFELVSSILTQYPSITPETIDTFIADTQWEGVIRVIDTQLLELMSEELEIQDEEGKDFVETIAQNLFGMHQAKNQNLPNAVQIQTGIKALLDIRSKAVSEKVPDETNRRRFVKTGLAIESAIFLSEVINDLKPVLAQTIEFSEDIFKRIIDLACRTVEMSDTDSNEVSKLGVSWLRTGNYQSVFEASKFDDLDTTIFFVEDVLCYKLPWVINGITRLLETQNTDTELLIPDWFALLPKYLRYGVDSKELAWIMSLGIEDRGFAEYLLQKYVEANQGNPANFRQFVRWATGNNEFLISSAKDEWPKYFIQILQQVLDRYAQIEQSL
jgi:superfamily II DNA/RNA helicase